MHFSRPASAGCCPAPRPLTPLYAFLTPCLGGLLFGLATAYITRRRGTEVDPIEANALHGGRMSIRGSLIVAAQTVWSSGVGASVGLEAGYTQLASGIASGIGRAFHLRRTDMRILVGCGAAAAIAGAFGAPLGCLPVVSGAAPDSQVHSALVRRRHWRLDHLHVVLSGGAVGG